MKHLLVLNVSVCRFLHTEKWKMYFTWFLHLLCFEVWELDVYSKSTLDVKYLLLLKVLRCWFLHKLRNRKCTKLDFCTCCVLKFGRSMFVPKAHWRKALATKSFTMMENALNLIFTLVFWSSGARCLFQKHIWHTVIATCLRYLWKKMLFVCNLNGVLSPLTWKWNVYFRTCKAS